MNYSYLNNIKFEKGKGNAIYLQIAHGIASLIKAGILKPGQKLPGSRILAEKLGVNRNTIKSSVDELLSEGWVITRARSGLFINASLPLVSPQKNLSFSNEISSVSGFYLTVNDMLSVPDVSHLPLQFNDGFPDPRLSPLNELGREYHKLLKKTKPLDSFSYAEPEGDSLFRKVLSQQLNEYRGMKTSPANLFITRGCIMGIYLVAQATLKPGDKVVIGERNYYTSNLCFKHFGAELLYIPVDDKGVDTHSLELLLQCHNVRMIYITSHHHHPTTVTLAPERRIHLYELAKQHKIIILEDDYDFDYHYNNKPTLPIASMDTEGLVIYVGSYSKIIYPSIRIGFLVASSDLILELCKYRRIIDRQGDHIMERAIANIILDGTMQRYLRKSNKIYKRRKEYFCEQLRKNFTNYIDFKEPEGGMAVWVTFKQHSLHDISKRCKERGLYLSDGTMHPNSLLYKNSCRMGFASMSEEEIDQSCLILKEVIEDLNFNNSI